ncbi:UNKNOWN [Stylonychia lemnae]|uniref:RAP domain-containing protein n=1 Tax=Stylonychia lemnae TaxID=5949 RepID=A0A078A076_STYLE|nr:UNKNOWN [Stylonychia lemnae]|eukprot:CDW75596.1 UNKNOWN [Stylonychia lemnae]
MKQMMLLKLKPLVNQPNFLFATQSIQFKTLQYIKIKQRWQDIKFQTKPKKNVAEKDQGKLARKESSQKQINAQDLKKPVSFLKKRPDSTKAIEQTSSDHPDVPKQIEQEKQKPKVEKQLNKVPETKETNTSLANIKTLFQEFLASTENYSKQKEMFKDDIIQSAQITQQFRQQLIENLIQISKLSASLSEMQQIKLLTQPTYLKYKDQIGSYIMDADSQQYLKKFNKEIKTQKKNQETPSYLSSEILVEIIGKNQELMNYENVLHQLSIIPYEKLSLTLKIAQDIDNIFSEIIYKNIDQINEVLHRINHYIFIMFKHFKNCGMKENLKKSIDIYLTQLSQQDFNKLFRKEGSKDYDKIFLRFLNLQNVICNEISFNDRLYQSFQLCNVKFLDFIDTIDLKASNVVQKDLVFFMLLIGKNNIKTPVFDKLNNEFTRRYQEKEIQLLDFQDAFISYLYLRRIDENLLQQFGLDKLSLEEIFTDAKLKTSDYIKFYELCSAGQIENINIWNLFLNKLKIFKGQLSILDTRMFISISNQILHVQNTHNNPFDENKIEELQTIIEKCKKRIEEVEQMQTTQVTKKKIYLNTTLEELINKTLKNIKNLEFEQEKKLLGSLFTADFYLKHYNVAIEVNGPMHYLKEIKDGQVIETDEYNGRFYNKVKVLERNGIKVIPIRYTEVNENLDSLKQLNEKIKSMLPKKKAEI